MIDFNMMLNPELQSLLAGQLAMQAPPPTLGTGLAPAAGTSALPPGMGWGGMMQPLPMTPPQILPPGVGQGPNPFEAQMAGLLPGEQAGIPTAAKPGLSLEQSMALAKMTQTQPENPRAAPAVSPHAPGKVADMASMGGGARGQMARPSLAQLLYGRG